MSRPTKRQLAQAILQLQPSYPADKLANAIAAYLVQERRTSELDALLREVNSLRATKGVREVSVSSAYPIDKETRAEIIKLVSSYQDNPTILLNEQRDQTIIGGVLVEADGLVLDTTIKNKLRHLYQLTSEA